MIVVCQVVVCPYNETGFCNKQGVVKIIDNGSCGIIWKKTSMGYVQKDFTKENDSKEPLIIIDVAEDEIKNISEDGKEELVQENS